MWSNLGKTIKIVALVFGLSGLAGTLAWLGFSESAATISQKVDQIERPAGLLGTSPTAVAE